MGNEDKRKGNRGLEKTDCLPKAEEVPDLPPMQEASPCGDHVDCKTCINRKDCEDNPTT